MPHFGPSRAAPRDAAARAIGARAGRRAEFTELAARARAAGLRRRRAGAICRCAIRRGRRVIVSQTSGPREVRHRNANARRSTRTHAPPVAGRDKSKKVRSRPVSRVLSWTVIPLGHASPHGSSDLPGCRTGRPIASLFGLAPGGVCRALRRWPRRRWALTPPFHPYHARLATPFGGIFLLHFPSARAAQALPGTLPCGARTFLPREREANAAATVWPTPQRHCTRPARTGL
jgi:hypothetical protein